MNTNKFRQMEDEMSRFEAEISGQAGNYGFGNIPPPPLLIPHQVKKAHKALHGTYDIYSTSPSISQKAVVSAKPTMYSTSKAPEPTIQTTQVDFSILQSEVEKKLKKLKNDRVSASLAISQGKSSGLHSSDHKHKSKKSSKLTRTAGGQIWEDLTLNDWPDDDFRLFCGDLGNDVSDELLTRTFNKYPSFNRARVIRDRRTNKSKGYGFISFKDPADFTKAMKEMNGRYVGSRPIKLRKSTWRNRCIDVVKKKEKEKAVLISMLTSGSNK